MDEAFWNIVDQEWPTAEAALTIEDLAPVEEFLGPDGEIFERYADGSYGPKF